VRNPYSANTCVLCTKKMTELLQHVTEMWAKRAALSGSAGTQGGGLPAAVPIVVVAR
jgi:hypothetical protein